LDLVAVSALEFGELGGEGAHHAAGGAVGRLCGRPRRPASLLDPQLLDTSADLGGPVEEVEPDAGGLREAAEGDGLSAVDHLPQDLLGAGLGGGALAGGGWRRLSGLPRMLVSFRPGRG
jgi:hypothetical protein